MEALKRVGQPAVSAKMVRWRRDNWCERLRVICWEAFAAAWEGLLGGWVFGLGFELRNGDGG